ncbi:unnamed protein product, partial [Symbiodinium sp. CCMP2456]
MSHVNQRQQCAAAALRGDFPKQQDSWSCGHRLVLAFQYLLSSLVDGCWPPAMPASEFSDEAIRDFCDGPEEREEPEDEEDRPLVKKPRLDSSGAAAAPKPAAAESKADGNPAPQKRRKLSQKEQDEVDAQKGRELFTAKKMSYEKHFQSAHHSEKQPVGKGHWRVFLLALARDQRLTCKTCSSLRDMVLLPEPSESSQRSQQLVPQDTETAYSGKGRPRTGQDGKRLQPWLEQHRPGIYRPVRGSWFFCEWCQKEVNFHRPGLSGLKYLRDHENSKGHQDPALPRCSVVAAVAGKDCQGILVGSGQCDGLDRLEDSLRVWVSHGLIQCTTTDPLDPAYSFQVSWLENQLVVKSRYCKPAEGSPCKHCTKVAGSRNLAKEIIHWSSRIAMVEYCKVITLGTDQEKRLACDALVQKDCYLTKEGRRDIDTLLAIDNDIAAVGHVKRILESIPKSRLTTRLSSWMAVHVRTLLRSGPALPQERASLRILSESFAESILSGEVLREDVCLASKVLAGDLTSDSVVRCLIHSFLQKQDKVRRGVADRLCTSKHVDEHTMQEILCTLGNSRETRQLLAHFGVTLGGKVSVQFENSLLPNFFVPNRSLDTMRSAVQALLPSTTARILGRWGLFNKLQQRNLAPSAPTIAGTRSWFLAVDETYWRANWELISGLRGEMENGRDFHCLPDVGVPDDSNLSKMTLDIIACCSYSLRQPWHLAMIPMPQGQNQKGIMQFRILDMVLHCISQETPHLPIGIATDAGACNKLTQDFLLGEEVPKAVIEDTRFFSRCESHNLDFLQYVTWGYRSIDGRPLVGSLDALHTLKRYSYHHNSCQRTIYWGSYFTDLSAMLAEGLPVKAYALADVQSDDASFQRLNPRYLQDSWSEVGAHVYVMISCLISLCTEGSEKISLPGRFRAATCAYGMLLLGLWAVRRRFDKEWTRWYLPIQTLRHLAAICTQQMALCIVVPDTCTVLGNKFQEKVAEYHYGSLKAPYRGVPSIRDAIVGGQLLRTKQLKNRQLPQPGKPCGRLTKAQAQALSK